MSDARHGAVVLRVGGGLAWLPASSVARLVPLPALGAVPNAPLDLAGVAHAGGEVMPVVDLRAPGDRARPPEGTLVVCTHVGEPLGLAGAAIVGVGHYDADPEHPESCVVGGERARPLDLAPIAARIGAHGWGRGA